MHQKRNYRNGIKCKTVLAEKKAKASDSRALKSGSPEILMCTECTLPASKCKGNCVYKGVRT